VAKLQLFEFIPYIMVLAYLVKTHGLVGAAVASLLRAALDAVVLSFLAYRTVPHAPNFLPMTAGGAAFATGAFYLSTLPHRLETKVAFLVITLGAFAFVMWSKGLGPAERVFLLKAGSYLRGRS
jgi:bifunctional pyridoxal-dependent enzyme with beta-cystathionase and maltose regulon repressor activities